MKFKHWALGATLIALLAGSTVQAHEWQNNPRYVDFKQHQNAVSAIDLDSTYVVKYAPPIYIIGGSRVMGTAWNGTGWHYGQFQWQFNYDTKEVLNYNQFNNSWLKVVDMDPAAIDGVFKHSYNIPFFGPNPLKQETQSSTQQPAQVTSQQTTSSPTFKPTAETTTDFEPVPVVIAATPTASASVYKEPVPPGVPTDINPSPMPAFKMPELHIGKSALSSTSVPVTQAMEQEPITHNPWQPVQKDVKK